MNMNRVWQGTAVGLVTVIGLMVVLIGLGLFDPKPFGVLRWQEVVDSLVVEAQSREVLWMAEEVEGVFTLRGTAVYQSGEKDIISGLVVGRDEDYFAIGVSPLGYVTLWQGEALLMPLQPWPHVNMGSEPNEIWLDVGEEEVAVWLNREILWTAG